MVIINRVRRLALCAMLSLQPMAGALAEPAVKPAITGLVSTGLTVPAFDDSTADTIAKKINGLFKTTQGEDLTGILRGIVIQVSWAGLEPTQPAANGPVTLNTAVLDAALDALRVINKSLPKDRPVGVRLRVFAGCSSSGSDAPDWAMSQDAGFPITITAVYDDAPEVCTVGQFWNSGSNYAQSWRQFQKALADKYDAEPLIREVSVTSCTSFSAEPFFLDLSAASGYQAPADTLNSAHFNDAVYQDCLTKAIDDYQPWKATRLEFSFNAFSGLGGQSDITISEQIMRRCRLTVEARCILSNRDLGSVPPSPSTVLPIYALERKFGPRITFQTFLKTPADYEGTIRKGLSLGAGAIEIWPGGYQQLTASTLHNWALMFEPQ